MNTSMIIAKRIYLLALIPILVLFLSAGVKAQDNKGKKPVEKQKYTIHILKDVNGEKTEIDTTFESEKEFDVQAWIESHDSGENDATKKEYQMQFSFPDFEHGKTLEIPDTVIMNGDTIIVNTQIEKMMKDFQEHGQPDLGEFFNRPVEPSLPDEGENWGSPEARCPFKGGAMPFSWNNIPGMERFLPFGNLEQIVIKKKRHGKKIIITFEDNDNDIVIRPGRENSYYYENPGNSPRHRSVEKQIRIEKRGSNNDSGDSSKVEHYKDGNKEVIIIHK